MVCARDEQEGMSLIDINYYMSKRFVIYDFQNMAVVLDRADYEDECEYERLQLNWFPQVFAIGTAYGECNGRALHLDLYGGVCKGRTGGCSIG